MSKLHLCIGLLAGLAAAPALMAGPALGAKPAPNQPGDINGNFLGKSRGSGLAGYLSPEQQAMLIQENHVTRLSDVDQQNWLKQQTEKLAGMSQTDRLQLQTKLQKEFDDLSQAQKDRIHKRLAARMTQQGSGLH